MLTALLEYFITHLLAILCLQFFKPCFLAGLILILLAEDHVTL